MNIEVTEKSLLFSYVVGYCGETHSTYVYLGWDGCDVGRLLGVIFEGDRYATVTVVEDSKRAKALSDSPEWLAAIREVDTDDDYDFN